jgi:colanic acid biosynthesis glycosyl transferase WcaI
VNILIVSQYFWPENFRINDLTRELVERGHCLSVLTGIPNYPVGKVFEAYKQDKDAFAFYEGAEVLRVPMFTRGQGNVSLFINYLSFVIGGCLYGPWRLRGKKIDVIFVFGLSPVTLALPAILLGRVKRVPVVMLVLDLWPESLAATGVLRSPRILSLVGYMVKFIYERCTLILGQSHSFLLSIAERCSNTDKIHYFPSWAEEVYNHSELIPAPEVPLQDGVFTVLFAGNVGEAQDFPAIMDAAEALKGNSSIRWIVVGDGRKSVWLQEEVMRRRLQDNVLLLGRFPVERMPSFYAHADALLVSLKKDPILSMTIPGKVQSYLMSGLPLIGMLDGEGAQVIIDSNAGLTCASSDGIGLASAILQMAATTTEQRHQLGLNGRAYAQKEFNRDLLMGRLEGLLIEAMASYTPKPKSLYMTK